MLLIFLFMSIIIFTFAASNQLNRIIMSAKVKNQLSEIMLQAWQFVKRNGYSMSEALKCAWANYKLRMAMASRIVKFYFQKIDGSIREAFGTLASGIVPETGDNSRRRNDSVQVYYDTEKADWRCFKRANLIRIA